MRNAVPEIEAMLLLRKPVPAAAGPAACLLLLAAMCAPAGAQNRRAACSDYAREAVAQYERNVRLRCDFAGPRWSDDRESHFAWCLATPRGAREESDIRHRMLEDCAGRRRAAIGGTRHADCDTYARISVVQAKAAEKYNCDFRGQEWSTDSDRHYRWCMGARRDYLIDQVRYRAADLQKCFDSLGHEERDDPDRRRY
jgi:hypothetical protein